MCGITKESELGRAIVAEIEKKIARGKPFSGYGIAQRVKHQEDGHGLTYEIYSYLVESPPNTVLGDSPSREVSSFIRELFNAHDPIFAGYACYPIPGGGPLMYFPIPQKVVDKMKQWGFPKAA
jgi:hypothetical protein